MTSNDTTTLTLRAVVDRIDDGQAVLLLDELPISLAALGAGALREGQHLALTVTLVSARVDDEAQRATGARIDALHAKLLADDDGGDIEL